MKLMLSNLGTRGYHCKELLVPKGWNSWFPTLEPPMQGTADSQRNVRYRFVLLVEPVAKRFVLLNGPVAESLRLADGPAKK